MTELDKSMFEKQIDDAVENAKDGSKILEELDPELDWVDLRDLIGERICIIRVTDSQPGLGTQARRVTYCGLDKQPFRFSTEHNVVIQQLDALEKYLPVWVTPAKSMSGNQLEYFHLT